MDLTSYLNAVAKVLDLPRLDVEQQGAFSVKFGDGQRVSVEVTEWPMVRLYHGLTYALHGNAVLVYQALLEWNMESPGPVLAMDEGDSLYLVQCFHAEECTPEGLAQAMAAFSQWGATVQQRLELLGDEGEARNVATVHANEAARDDGWEKDEAPPLFDTRLFA